MEELKENTYIYIHIYAHVFLSNQNKTNTVRAMEELNYKNSMKKNNIM